MPKIAMLALTLVTGLIMGLTLAKISDDSPSGSKAVATFQQDPPPQQPVSGQQNPEPINGLLQAEDANFEQRLNEEKIAREHLENELAKLRGEVERLAKQLASLQPNILPVDTTNPHTSATSDPVDATTDMVSQLVDVGVAPQRAQEIKARYDRIDMDRLFLRDRAIREGWLNTPKYRDAVAKLGEESLDLREEIGDEDYDRLLYATNQFNRVRIEEVMSASPAQRVGIETGDIIYAYADQRIFTWDELRQATTGGEAGEQVHVKIIRGEKTLDLYLPRGPLGVKLDTAKIKP